MKKGRIVLVSLVGLLMAMLLIGCGKTDKLETEIKHLKRENSSREAEVESLKQQTDEILAEKQDSEQLQNQNEELQAQLDNANAEISKLKKDTEKKERPFTDIKFWKDGKTYTITREDFELFSDCFCSNKVKGKVKLVSPIVDVTKLSNGITVYTFMSEEGLVYGTSRPSLEEVTEETTEQ